MEPSIFDNQYIEEIIANPVFADIPRTEMWRLGTDGWLHINGPGEYPDKYHLHMQKGLCFILKHKNHQITADLIKQLHQEAYPSDDSLHQNFRSHDITVSFPVTLTPKEHSANPVEFFTSAISTEGISSLVERAYQEAIEHKNPWFFAREIIKPYPIIYSNGLDDLNVKLNDALHLYRENPDQGRVIITQQGTKNPETNIEDRVTQIINAYYHKIGEATTESDKISLIIETIRSLHLLHPFTDGNGRTFIFLLKNWMFLQNNLLPMINETPNHFTGFSNEELVQEYQEGVQQFIHLKVTALIEIIERPSGDLSDKIEEIKQHLNENPIIAASQINEIYLRLKEKHVTPMIDRGKTLIGFHSQSITDKLCIRLEKIYITKIYEFLSTFQKLRFPKPNESESTPVSQLLSLTTGHALIKSSSLSLIMNNDNGSTLGKKNKF